QRLSGQQLQCSCYTKVWCGLACFDNQVCQYLVMEQREFHTFLYIAEHLKPLYHERNKIIHGIIH
ncbi:hypothetical protein EZS27_015858, partial [termite gut metagenome]